jgi:TPR repeat protein
MDKTQGLRLPTEDKFKYMSGLALRMPADELQQKILDALDGDPQDSRSVVLHYGPGMQNYDESFKWNAIAAENGSGEGYYRFSNILINFGDKSDYRYRIRGTYWLYTMVKNNYRIETTEGWLNYLGYSIDTAKPPEDGSFPDNYTEFLISDIIFCGTSALQGGKKPALLLGKYYEGTTVAVNNELSEFWARIGALSNNLSEFWYRIGAQNGSFECMYELGQIFIAKENELDQRRGKFWLKQAAQNGYNL